MVGMWSTPASTVTAGQGREVGGDSVMREVVVIAPPLPGAATEASHVVKKGLENESPHDAEVVRMAITATNRPTEACLGC